MIIETALTTYLRRKYQHTLNFSTFEQVAAPAPDNRRKYLLYIHIPFCEELCPYCSFNRFKLDIPLAKRYFHALSQEIAMYRERGFRFDAIYVGGGTPTVLPDEMGKVLLQTRDWFGVTRISLETNPNHLTNDIMTVMKQAGVNRLSVGVQSFDDALLRKMERFHKYGSGQQIKEKLSHFMGMFDTLNVDMIFNFPSQTTEMLEKDLEIIMEIPADQATFYPLMVSNMTRHALAKRFGAISYRQEKQYYHLIVSRLLPQYSFGTAWCFSRKKQMIDEYIVDHDEYVGVGSGSFGYLNGTCYANTFFVEDYIQTVQSGKLPLKAKRDFSLQEQIQYDFMMQLFGGRIDVARAEEKFQGQFQKTLRKEIALFTLLGAVYADQGVLRLTNRGRYLWVIMMREFFTGVNNFRDLCRGFGQTTDVCAA
ncbi:MAG: coproporphyrinogen III oxidase family protein [Desulfomonilaceae bacterium]